MDDVSFSFSVPTSGWGSGPTEGLPGGGFRSFGFQISKDTTGSQGAEAVIFWTSFPDGDEVDPCAHLRSLPADVSAADLAAAVATAPGTEVVEGPSTVTVDGRPAHHVVLDVRRDLGCDPGYFFTWPHDDLLGALWDETEVFDRIGVWIVDVDGTRLVIEAVTTAYVDIWHEIGQIVESIRWH